MPHPIADDAQVHAAVAAVMADGTWCDYQGPAIDQLEAKLAAAFDRRYVQLCCSGTLATELALRGLRIQPGDEVMLGGYDFPGNFRAVESIGGRPVLIDCSYCDWTIDLNRLEAAYSPACKAIIVSHLHGSLTPMAEIIAFAKRRGLKVVEDSCQAPGAVVDGRPAGSWGDCSTLSFGGSKLLTSGRGGAVLCDDPRIAQRIAAFKDRGNDAFALSILQAAALNPQVDQLGTRHSARSQTAYRLRLAIEERFGWLTVPPSTAAGSPPQQHSPAYYKFGVFLQPQPASPRPQLMHHADPATVRRELLEHLLHREIPAGEGFRGFHRRIGTRARSEWELINARFAAEATILIHHAALDASDEPRLLAAFEEFERHHR